MYIRTQSLFLLIRIYNSTLCTMYSIYIGTHQVKDIKGREKKNIK